MPKTCLDKKFKDSPVGEIPKDWDVKTLKELCVGNISNGFFKKPELVGSGYRLINVFDLYQDFGINLNLVERVNATEQEQKKYAVQPGDIFFTRSSLVLSGIAHCNIIRDIPEAALFECHLMRVRPDKNQVVPEFLALWCRSPKARQFLMGRAKQVTMTTIAQPDIAPLPVPLPPKREQERIVEIHDSLDSTIAQTSTLIAKLKQMKAGLLHDLLTRGLDENGELRNAIDRPEQFKDSPLGQIPKDWDIGSFEKLADAIDPQPDHRAPAEVQDGKPYVGVGDFRLDGSIDFDSCRKVSPAALAKQQQRFCIEPGDIIFGKIGTIGLPRFLPQGLEYALNANTVLIKPKTCPSYVMALLNSKIVEQQIQLQTHSTSQPAFGIQRIRAMLTPIPSEGEQFQITAVLDSYEVRIRAEETYLNKLKEQKKGLMHDLLTGRVRVTDLKEIPA